MKTSRSVTQPVSFGAVILSGNGRNCDGKSYVFGLHKVSILGTRKHTFYATTRSVVRDARENRTKPSFVNKEKLFLEMVLRALLRLCVRAFVT